MIAKISPNGSLSLLLAILCAAAFVARTEGVPVYVTASLQDKNRLFIEDLGQEEIRIFEDNQLREIEFMAKDELPVAYAVLFERTLLPGFYDEDRLGGSSVGGPVATRDIIYELIDKYLGRQAIWVAAFDNELEVALDFTVDGFRVKQALMQLRSRRNINEPFLYGALLNATSKLTERRERRRVLLLFLDSIDVTSTGKMKLLKNLLSTSNVELFIVSFASKLRTRRWGMPFSMNLAALSELAHATAGDSYSALQYGDHLEDISRRIYNHIRTFYTFGFRSRSSAKKPGELRIECTRPGSKVRFHRSVAAHP